MSDTAWEPRSVLFVDERRAQEQFDVDFALMTETGDAVEVSWWRTCCWRCPSQSVVWWVAGTQPWQVIRDEDRPEVVSAVLSACENRPPMAYLSFRSSRPRPNGYMAFGCPHCHAILGDHYLNQELTEYRAAGLLNTVSVVL